LYAIILDGYIVTVEFFAEKDKPIFLEYPSFLLFFQDHTFFMDRAYALAAVANIRTLGAR
jgi:hypothetical protein